MPDTNYFKNKITSFKSHFSKFWHYWYQDKTAQNMENALSDIDKEIIYQ
jgi:hypothetical protein